MQSLLNHNKSQQCGASAAGSVQNSKQDCHLLSSKQPIMQKSSSHVMGQPNAGWPAWVLLRHFLTPEQQGKRHHQYMMAASVHNISCIQLSLQDVRHYRRCLYEMRCGKSRVMAAASNTITAAVATMALLSPDWALPVCRPAPHTMQYLLSVPLVL